MEVSVRAVRGLERYQGHSPRRDRTCDVAAWVRDLSHDGLEVAKPSFRFVRFKPAGELGGFFFRGQGIVVFNFGEVLPTSADIERLRADEFQ